MDSRKVLGIITILVGVSLVLAPITMSDWSEQATLSTERIDESQLSDDVPIIQFQNLSNAARDAVERAISSLDGSVTIYGKGSWPDRFHYSDFIFPGRGLYAIQYQGDLYRLSTFASGGFTFIYWLLELPIIGYGLALLWIGLATGDGIRSRRFAALATIPGVMFHLLGPALDFPVLSPGQFVEYGIVAIAGLLVVLFVTHVRRR